MTCKRKSTSFMSFDEFVTKIARETSEDDVKVIKKVEKDRVAAAIVPIDSEFNPMSSDSYFRAIYNQSNVEKMQSKVWTPIDDFALIQLVLKVFLINDISLMLKKSYKSVLDRIRLILGFTEQYWVGVSRMTQGQKVDILVRLHRRCQNYCQFAKKETDLLDYEVMEGLYDIGDDSLCGNLLDGIEDGETV